MRAAGGHHHEILLEIFIEDDLARERALGPQPFSVNALFGLSALNR